ISEWMVGNDEYQLSDSDYAVRIDLMTQVFGIDAAERYFEGLPSSAKTSETYTALLHCYAGSKLIEKAEGLYERMKGANLSLGAITYNELMTLYMSVGQLEKVPQIVKDMKCQNVAPDLFTYNLWISSCAAALNMDEVRRILDAMVVDSSCNESWIRYQKLAKLYINSTQLVNSDFSSLVESEKGITQRELISYDFLIILYGGLGNKDKLDQIWKSLTMTGQKMTGRNYVCVLSSYLMLGHLEEVGEIVGQWKQSATSEFNSSMCNKLLAAFEEIGMADTAASFHTILREKGCDLTDEPR
ncbi:Tetratricopeptide repeat superfamily protein, partial [Perilla frutescens var. frutescens]